MWPFAIDVARGVVCVFVCRGVQGSCTVDRHRAVYMKRTSVANTTAEKQRGEVLYVSIYDRLTSTTDV